MTDPFLIGIASEFFVYGGCRFENALTDELGPIAGVEYREWTPGTGPPEALKLFDALLLLDGSLAPEMLDGTGRLAVIARWGSDYDEFDIDALTRAGIALTTTPESGARSTAEFILALILALGKNVIPHDGLVRHVSWPCQVLHPGVDLKGCVLGSIGCSNVAREMFRLAQIFQFRCLLAYDPHLSQPEVVDLGIELVDLETLCRESDFLTINAPLTAETRELMTARQFRMMKPTACFINTSRAPIASQPALIQALDQKWIAGAALDLPPSESTPEHPLLRRENVILAPHSVSWTQSVLRGNLARACHNILQVARGEVPDALINSQIATHPGFIARLERYRSKASLTTCTFRRSHPAHDP
jgi:phosphoglycerate dehydrogenase-like enzyme